MIIEVDLEILGAIVDKHVGNFFSRWELSRKQKRAGTYKRICGGIRKYQSDLKECFLPVLRADFSGTVSIKIAGSQMEKKEVEKLTYKLLL